MTIHSTVIQKLLSTSAHLGKRVAAHHFKIYTYGVRNGMTIIDSDKTLICIRNACHFISNFLCDEIVDQMTKRIGCGANSLWNLGGFLTNSGSPKKFRSQNKKLHLGSTQPPDCLVIMDTERKSSVIFEAEKLQIPIVGLVNSNTPWDVYKRITYPIPANDSVKFVYLFCNLITKTFLVEQKKVEERGTKLLRLTFLVEQKKVEERGTKLLRLTKTENGEESENLKQSMMSSSKDEDLVIPYESLALTSDVVNCRFAIVVCNGVTYLDLIINQIESINSKHGWNVPLILMNTIRTHDGTMKSRIHQVRRGKDSDDELLFNMSDHASSHAPSMSSAPTKSDDPAWAYGRLVPGKKNNTICTFCEKHLKGGGITRLKQHLAGIKGEVEACKKVSLDVKWQMKQVLEEYKQEKERRERVSKDVGLGPSYDERDEEECLIEKTMSDEATKKKRRQISGFFAPRTTPGAQPSIKSALSSKEAIDEAKMAVARWWYDANIPFNATLSPYYQPAIDAMVSVGPGFKGPSYHDLRCPLLNKCVRETKEYLDEMKECWKTYGCSIMSDGWTSQNQTPVINFLVYCPKGTMFLKSKDMSGIGRTADVLLAIFEEIVDEVGPKNIVQFVTDNDATYKAAGKMLQATYGCFYWSPCAAHCLDLMLENFAKPKHFPEIDATIQKAKKITRYIYNHAWVVNLMRKEFTNGRDLCRPGVTRFATNFLSIQCIMNFKKELRQMFTSDKWLGSRYAKERGGKEIVKIILEDREFWSKCQLVVKVSEPLVRVLRLTDGDEKPCMGYLYEAMDKAKEAIKVRFNNRLSLYTPYTRVVDARWDRQLYSPLHAAGCFLNPGTYFKPSFTKKTEVVRGMIQALTVLVPDNRTQDLISLQMEEYKQSTGDFGMALAIRQREKLNPDL